MASMDMFDKTFAIGDMKATGKIKYPKNEVDFLCACIIQMDGAGQITGGAFGAATQGAVAIKNGAQPKWELDMRMMPNAGGHSRKLKSGQSATGLALYRRTSGQLAVWVTSDITVEA